jgi:hypothetical protein
MTCPDCGSPLPAGAARCDACARDDAMFAAYARGIDVPPMWDAIEARLPRRRRVVGWPAALAAAALLALVVAGALVLRAPAPPPRDASPASVAAARYREAIGRLEPRAPRATAALLPPLTAAIDEAEREARRAPDDPIAVTRLVAAYDAKLQLLRTYD